MILTPRRRIPCYIGASCLAAALAFSTGATVAMAAPQAPAPKSMAVQDDSGDDTGSDQSGSGTGGDTDTGNQSGSDTGDEQGTGEHNGTGQTDPQHNGTGETDPQHNGTGETDPQQQGTAQTDDTVKPQAPKEDDTRTNDPRNNFWDWLSWCVDTEEGRKAGCRANAEDVAGVGDNCELTQGVKGVIEKDPTGVLVCVAVKQVEKNAPQNK
ncbi:hypothetical protein [Streptomyces nojiriensis]|uniref:hypothetical protein n=1 Tax=Streptomyces nojiriensis TaxID=66374 RepID=UPI0036BB5A9E